MIAKTAMVPTKTKKPKQVAAPPMTTGGVKPAPAGGPWTGIIGQAGGVAGTAAGAPPAPAPGMIGMPGAGVGHPPLAPPVRTALPTTGGFMPPPAVGASAPMGPAGQAFYSLMGGKTAAGAPGMAEAPLAAPAAPVAPANPVGPAPPAGTAEAAGLQSGAPPPPAPYPGPGREFKNAGSDPHALGGRGFLKKLRSNAPGWLQDSGVFDQGMQNLMEILQSGGEVDPSVLFQGQADIGQGQLAGHQAQANRLAAAGIDPSSPMAMDLAGQVDTGANALRADVRRGYDQQKYDRKLNALQAINPFLTALTGYTSKHGGANISGGAPTGGGQQTDWAGIIGGLANSGINAYGNYLGAQG